MCRLKDESVQFFLVHPGGPFFQKKYDGVWSIPKGLPEEGEALQHAAIREFEEETGMKAQGPFYDVGEVVQKGGKKVYCWTFLGEWDPEAGISSNTFRLEWPPGSGRFQDFPEQDRAQWMDLADARIAINPAQIPFLERSREIHLAKKTR